jgi:hypothetical protein
MGQKWRRTGKRIYGKGNENHKLGKGLSSARKRNILAVKRVEFVSDRMTYIILRGRWCDNFDSYTHC